MLALVSAHSSMRNFPSSCYLSLCFSTFLHQYVCSDLHFLERDFQLSVIQPLNPRGNVLPSSVVLSSPKDFASPFFRTQTRDPNDSVSSKSSSMLIPLPLGKRKSSSEFVDELRLPLSREACPFFFSPTWELSFYC